MHIRIALAASLLWCAGCTQDPGPGSEDPSEARAVAVLSSTSAPLTRARDRSFADAPDRGDLVAYPARRVVRHDGAYTWHRADLSEEHALRAVVDGNLTVTTPSGATLRFRHERHVEHPSGDWTWIGKLEGDVEGGETILTFGKRAAFGTIAQPGKESLKLTIRNGGSWLVETDSAALGRIDNAATRPHGQDFVIPPKLPDDSDGRPMEMAAAPAMEGQDILSQASIASVNPTVDLVLGYTSGFASGLGGQSQAVTRLNFLVDVANQAYANSQVSTRVRLVHTVEVSYGDATANGTALEELTGFKAPSTVTTPNAAFSGLRAARDRYGADLVSMVRKFSDPQNDGCGIAWLIGGGQSGIDGSDERFGYSVVSDGFDQGSDGKTYFCREETLAHEVGHNMGLQHDRSAATIDGTVKYGVYPYSFGYKTAAGAGNFYTVMAYGETGQARYRVLSNPRSTYCGGYACGVEGESDNARTLTQTSSIISAFRATVVANPPRRVVTDVDGDAHSDILWHNATAGRFGHWLMDGAAVKHMANQSVATGYRIPASGDFDGNGRMDVLWTSSVRDLWMWLGTGTGAFVSAYLGTYSGNWALSGAGDINADGRDDILWHDSIDGQLSYWMMNGASVTKIVNIPVTVGYRIASLGDFNGDGLLDIFWTSAKGDLWLWSGTVGGQFTSNFMGTYGQDWAVIGAGDINADGMDDLLWHNALKGRLSYWLLNGPSVIRTAEMGVAVGYRVASTGDYNGDGRVDLIWTSNNLDLWMWSGSSLSTFTSNYLGTYGNEWRVVDPAVR